MKWVHSVKNACINQNKNIKSDNMGCHFHFSEPNSEVEQYRTVGVHRQRTHVITKEAEQK